MARGYYPGRTQRARNWYRDVASTIVVGDEKKLLKNEIHFARKRIYPGFLYSFIYDAKTKDKMPYWDACPLVFPWRKIEADPIKGTGAGFIGINLHYLPPMLRAKLMDDLYPLVQDDRFNDNSRLQKFTYEVLRQYASAKEFEPCIHRYLDSHVKSRLYKIPANSWDVALMLPTERFQKASKETVWSRFK